MKDKKNPNKKKQIKKTNLEKKPVGGKKTEIKTKEEIIKKEDPKENINKSNLFPLLLFSLLTSILAVFLAYYYSSSSHAFVFSGFNDYITVDSGLISTNHRFNAFEGNNISYINKEDIMVYRYDIGYYVKVNDFKTSIISTSATFTDPKSLKDVVNSIVGFNFIEPAKIKNGLLDKESIDLINDGHFYFFITYDIEVENQIVTETIELRLNVKDN